MKRGKIACTRQQLDLGITLNGGQSFRWLALENGARYRGVFYGGVWTLTQDNENLHWVLHGSSGDDKSACSEQLERYLNLRISLEDNISRWSSRDSRFGDRCGVVPGVRILNQDIVENLFSFICSSNNNIPRISSMVRKMCRHFGDKICRVDGQEYYDFPTVEALSRPEVEGLLRKEGFGYRAAYVAKTAKKLMLLGSEEWLRKLSGSNGASYDESRERLMSLDGIGPKVADCICLMSLGHLEAIPVDTHIFQVARETYMPHLKTRKAATRKTNDEIGAYLRQLWGPLAGWAQAIIFCAKIHERRTNVSPKRRKVAD